MQPRSRGRSRSLSGGSQGQWEGGGKKTIKGSMMQLKGAIRMKKGNDRCSRIWRRAPWGKGEKNLDLGGRKRGRREEVGQRQPGKEKVQLKEKKFNLAHLLQC